MPARRSRGASAASCLRVDSDRALVVGLHAVFLRHDVRRERTRRRIQRRQRAQPQVLVVEHVVHRVVVQIGDFGRVEGRLLWLVELALQLRPPAGAAMRSRRWKVAPQRADEAGQERWWLRPQRMAQCRPEASAAAVAASPALRSTLGNESGRAEGRRSGRRQRGGDLSLLLWWWCHSSSDVAAGKESSSSPCRSHALSSSATRASTKRCSWAPPPAGYPAGVTTSRRHEGRAVTRSSEVMASMSGDTAIEAAGRTTSRANLTAGASWWGRRRRRRTAAAAAAAGGGSASACGAKIRHATSAAHGHGSDACCCCCCWRYRLRGLLAGRLVVLAPARRGGDGASLTLLNGLHHQGAARSPTEAACSSLRRPPRPT